MGISKNNPNRGGKEVVNAPLATPTFIGFGPGFWAESFAETPTAAEHEIRSNLKLGSRKVSVKPYSLKSTELTEEERVELITIIEELVASSKLTTEEVNNLTKEELAGFVQEKLAQQ